MPFVLKNRIFDSILYVTIFVRVNVSKFIKKTFNISACVIIKGKQKNLSIHFCVLLIKPNQFVYKNHLISKKGSSNSFLEFFFAYFIICIIYTCHYFSIVLFNKDIKDIEEINVGFLITLYIIEVLKLVQFKVGIFYTEKYHLIGFKVNAGFSQISTIGEF